MMGAGKCRLLAGSRYFVATHPHRPGSGGQVTLRRPCSISVCEFVGPAVPMAEKTPTAQHSPALTQVTPRR
jgi:hypothetical protein